MKTNKIMVYTYVGVAILEFVWRFATTPWDFGGCFYQAWFAALGIAFFSVLYPRLGNACQQLALVIMLPIATFLLFGTVYFAPQALFPFMFVAFVLATSLFLWSKSKRPLALLVSLLLFPLGAYCLYGYSHMAFLVRLRSLEPDDVIELRFTAVSKAKESITVSTAESIENILSSLKDTHPYSPNHEGIEHPWRLTVITQEGPPLDLSLSSGNRAHPTFVWIEFGVEVYQNAELRKALLTTGVNLWE